MFHLLSRHASVSDHCGQGPGLLGKDNIKHLAEAANFAFIARKFATNDTEVLLLNKKKVLLK